MKKFLMTVACIGAMSACQLAHAVTISAVIGGSAPVGPPIADFNSPAGNPTLPAGLTVVITSDAQYATSSLENEYAAPFGDITQYVTSGSPTGANPNSKVTISFATSQTALGLLWGSVDNYNTITFYANANATGAFTTVQGTAVLAANGALVNGSQLANGTAYVTISDLPSFRSAVFSSSQKALEFDDLAFNIPDGGSTLALAGLAMISLGMLRRKMA